MIEIYNSFFALWTSLFPQAIIENYANLFEFTNIIIVLAVVVFCIVNPILSLFKLIFRGVR